MSLTPLIDVVFILLVFFMLASSFVKWRAVELDAAGNSPAASNTSPLEPLTLTVSAEQTQLNGETMPLAQMLPLIQTHLQKHHDQVLRVQPLADTSLQTVIHLLDALQYEGITRLTMNRDANWQEASALQ
ncbi:MAG TPA: biopolymer transporter ExbD [Cellvibrionaceae bacterium]